MNTALKAKVDLDIHTVPGMCDGCARDSQARRCSTITEPGYINRVRDGNCWAKMDRDKARRIEIEIKAKALASLSKPKTGGR